MYNNAGYLGYQSYLVKPAYLGPVTKLLDVSQWFMGEWGPHFNLVMQSGLPSVPIKIAVPPL